MVGNTGAAAIMNKVVAVCRISLFLIVLQVTGLVSALQAQDTPGSRAAGWRFSSANQGDHQYVIEAMANIRPRWRLFSTTMPDSLPNSRISIEPEQGVSFLATFEGGVLHELREPSLDSATILYFEDSAALFLMIRVKEGWEGPILGSVRFMAMKGDSVEGVDSIPFRFFMSETGQLAAVSAGLKMGDPNALGIPSIDVAHPVNDCGGATVAGGGLMAEGGGRSATGLLRIFLLGLLGGCIALITPCVFPMIPLTVAQFIKNPGNERAGTGNSKVLLYGVFIVAIYIGVSIPFYFMHSGQETILNSLSTNTWVNLAFFIIFVVLALSLFGVVNFIRLPRRLLEAADAGAGTGSTLGLAFLALTLALTSFSCTGPILGTLLAGAVATTSSAVELTIGMAGFGLGLAAPLTLLAIFPRWLRAVPSSGTWLLTGKTVLGFIELGLSLKFLSNADLVGHWGILPREAFILIWIVLGIGMAWYLVVPFYLIRSSWRGRFRDKAFGTLERILAVVVIAFIIYLFPGLTNTRFASRALISGFAPPLSYSIYKEHVATGQVAPDVVNDYDQALALARSQHKPILLDFTGWGCVNCRKMEENVWSKPGVKALIQDEFILVSLYVDDRKALPERQQFIYSQSSGDLRRIVTVGDKFSVMEAENFGSVSQPLYAIISPDQQLLNRPIGYTSNSGDYADWLRCGVTAYRQLAGSEPGYIGPAHLGPYCDGQAYYGPGYIGPTTFR